MKFPRLLAVPGLLLLLGLRVRAATHYVNAGNPTPVPPYTDWATAATNIQDAVGLAGVNDVVVVTNGIYQYGGASASGSNRVYAVVAVKIQSVNGPDVTIIKGYQVPGTTNGSSAMRCVYLGEFSTLSGFTLTGGATQAGGNGGGVYAVANCVVSNCVIAGNAASGNGGGCFGASSLLMNCVISGNWSGASGGGANNCLLNYCIVTNNFAMNGGGMASGVANNCLFTGNGSTNSVGGTSGGAAYLATLNNCTVVGNFSHGLGAADGCKLANSIIYYNDNGNYADCYQCQLTNCCTPLGLGNSTLPNNSISNAPAFADQAHGDFHLQVYSPCINTGTNLYAPAGTDLDGNPRIANGTVDMGAFENQNTNPVHFVRLGNSAPVTPFTNWLTAATNIQDAIDTAAAGDFIVVSNGLYNYGGRAVYGIATNRVTVDKAVTVQSVNGPGATTIAGATVFASDYQVRCVYLTNGAILSGFTLTNGACRHSGDLTNEQSGGGAWCEVGGVVSNCIVMRNAGSGNSGSKGGGIYGGTVINSTILTNSAYFGGGVASADVFNCLIASNTVYTSGLAGGSGAYGSRLSHCLLMANNGDGNGGGANACTLDNCVLSNNSCWYSGGGAYNSTLTNCLLFGNSAGDGGGACLATLFNCLVISNSASQGGGADRSSLYNCTVARNRATSTGSAGGVVGYVGPSAVFNSIVFSNVTVSGVSNYANSVTFQNSCTWPLPANGVGNFTNAPLFVNDTNDFHLQSDSPCINAGNNAYVSTITDSDGNPRILGGTVDAGAFEYQSPASMLSYVWAQQYGLPTDGSADATDTDGDGLSNFAEWKAGTIPTDSASVLQLAAPANGVSGLVVTWQSVTNVTYYLQRSSDLAAGFTSIVSNLVGQAGTTSYTDTTATDSVPYFYRVGVQ